MSTTHVHRLKTWPDLFRRIAEGSKTFDLRRDDRGFQNGDVVELVEYDPTKAHECADPSCSGNRLTGAVLRMQIGFVAKGTFFGLNLGEYAILSLLPVDATSPGAGRRLFNPGDPEPDESVRLQVTPAVGQSSHVFRAGDPEPGPETLAVRWLDDTEGNWIWHRLTGADSSGESDWVARGREGDGSVRRWSQICHGRNQVVDVTGEVTR